MLAACLHLGSLDMDRTSSAWRAIACSNARDWRQWPAVFEQYWLPHKIKGTVKVSGQANFIEVLGGGAKLSSQPRLRLSLVDFGGGRGWL